MEISYFVLFPRDDVNFFNLMYLKLKELRIVSDLNSFSCNRQKINIEYHTF